MRGGVIVLCDENGKLISHFVCSTEHIPVVKENYVCVCTRACVHTLFLSGGTQLWVVRTHLSQTKMLLLKTLNERIVSTEFVIRSLFFERHVLEVPM
jgi:hypothetical protein